MEKNEPATDRRVKRTRRLLQGALAELMTQKKFREITVQDITDRADVNRSTFYLHYQDTYDLLLQIEDGLISGLEAKIAECRRTARPYNLHALVECVYDFLEDNMQFCRPLFLSNSNTPFWQKFMEVLAEKGIELPEEMKTDRPNVRWYQMTFIVHGVIGVLREWISADNVLPKDDMVDTMERLVNAAIQAV